MKNSGCGNHRVDPANSDKLDQALEARGVRYAKGSHPKGDPQALANIEHLNSILRKQGPDAAVAEFRKMFAPGGSVPPIETRHRAKAAAYRRWNDLPPLPKEQQPQASESKPETVETSR